MFPASPPLRILIYTVSQFQPPLPCQNIPHGPKVLTFLVCPYLGPLPANDALLELYSMMPAIILISVPF